MQFAVDIRQKFPQYFSLMVDGFNLFCVGVQRVFAQVTWQCKLFILLEKFGSGQSIETIVQLAADSSDIKFIERSELNIDFES